MRHLGLVDSVYISGYGLLWTFLEVLASQEIAIGVVSVKLLVLPFYGFSSSKDNF